MNLKKPKIVLITGFWSKKNRSIVGTASKLMNILKPLSDETTWIITNHSIKDLTKANLIEIEYKGIGKSFLKILFYHFLYQAKIMLIILKLIRLSRADIFIFAYGSDLTIFPILLGRLLRKKVIIRTDGRQSITSQKHHDKPNKGRIVLYNIIEKVTYLFANKIVSESKCMVDLYNLKKYQPKINIGSQYVAASFFTKTKKLNKRKYIVGYIGRLSTEKGVLEFAQSLPLILKGKESGKALIVGEGDVKGKVREILVNNNVEDEVELTGWIENKELPTYLNEIKVLVFPSCTEGLPNIVLEAMACGTPVLATPVGGIPDVIRDGETGFIMEDNTPECIAKNVIRALNHPDLEKITKNARALIEKEYTLEAAAERYKKILENI